MKNWLAVIVLLLVGCVDLDAVRKSYAERDIKEKIGILAHTDITWPNSTSALKRALGYFRAEGVSTVVFVGEVTKNGYAEQKRIFESAWAESWRGGVAPQRIFSTDPYKLGAIAFTAASRLPLTDELCVYPHDGKTINVGSMRGFDVSSLFQKPSKQVQQRIANSAQGLLVGVKTDGVMEVKRLDFSGAKVSEVGSPWLAMPDGAITSVEGKAPPQFWSDTRIAVVRGYDAKGEPVYTVRWPPVLAKHTGERAFSYDVEIKGKVLRSVQSEAFWLSEAEDGAALSCLIAERELNGAAPRFGVTPISPLGVKGRTVWSE